MLSFTPLTASFTSTKAPEIIDKTRQDDLFNSAQFHKTYREKKEEKQISVKLESADRTLLFCGHEKQILITDHKLPL